MQKSKQHNSNPPIAKKIPTKLEKHGHVRTDNYYWMKLSDQQKNAEEPDDQTQDVIDYLNAENAYTKEKTEHLEGLKGKLYSEMVGRIKQTDMSVPYVMNGFRYQTRFEEGKEYPIYERQAITGKTKTELLLNVNELAKDFDYYNVKGMAVSTDNSILAYGEDTLSRRIYTIRFRDIKTGDLLADVIENTTGSPVWANDNKTIFYTRKDATLRAYKIYRHILGRPTSEDVEVYHEKDDTFNCYVYKTKSKKYIVIGSFATVSSEFRILDANVPSKDFKVFQDRERKHEYSITHFKDRWYIITNESGAKNFKVMSTHEDKTEKKYWEEFIGHRDNVLLSSIEVFNNYLVINERIEGISKVRIRNWVEDVEGHYIEFGEEAYMASTSQNPELDTSIVRVYFTSMTTPGTTYDYDMESRDLTLMKRQEVVGDFNSEYYISERLNVAARDGSQVPVSLVYRKDVDMNGEAPLLLYAYGSYGSSMDPYFSSVRLSLLDRGFVFAIAHIRGGQELGRQWYEDGKLLSKKNTFHDFIDVGESLVSRNYTNKQKLYAMGGSAGGLLIGAVVNMRPDLWHGAIAAVPFVDVITTMLDDSIPLTTGEYDEWGNPNEKEYYDYILSYSPYDQLKEQAYPHMLVTTGYHDSQVQYWEPAKWVAKLRDMKTDDNLLLLHTEMEAGHGGKSGRFQRYYEIALEYAFLLDLAGKAN